MTTKTIAWNSGSGNITLTYGGQGDGTITIESADNNLYEARSQEIVIQTTAGSPQVTKTITITQAAKMRIDLSSAIVTAANQTYNGSAKTPVPTVILDGETVPSTGYDVTYSNNTNAGTATITVTGKGDYTGTATGTFTIAKANPTYTAPVANTLTYTGSSQYLITTGSTSHGTIQYSANGSSWSTTRPSQTNAGTYTAYWKLVGDSNHNDVTSTQISNVGIAQKAVTITAKAQSVTYGTAITQSTSQVTSTGLVSGHSVTAITLTQSTTNVTTTGTITPSAATIKQSSTDVTANYSITYNTGTLTITAVPASVTTAPTAKTLSYTGSAQALVNAGTADGGTMYYQMTTTNSKPTSTSGFSTAIPTGTNAGSAYYVWYYVKGDSNHTDTAISSTAVNVTMSKVAPTYTAPTAKTLTYSRASQALLNAGSTSDGTIQYSSNNSTWSTTIPTQTNAGTYTVYWRLNGDSNHNSIESTAISVTIAKQTPVLNVSPTIRTGLTYTSSAQNLLQGGSMKHSSTNSTSVTGTFAYQQETNAGSYVNPTWSFTPTGSYATNYNSTSGYVEGTASIAKVAPTYTAPTTKTDLVYNGTGQVLLNAGSTNHGTIEYSSDNSTWSTTIPSGGPNAGSYTSYWRLIGDSNHTDKASASITTTIAKAPGYITVHPVANNLTYTGSAQNCCTAGSGSGDLYYRIAPSTGWNQSIPKVTDAGDYTLEYAARPTTNYDWSATYSLAIHVAKADRTISFVNPPQSIHPFESITLETSVSAGSSDGTITITSSDSSLISVNGNAITGVVAGNTVTITATISGGTNYNNASTSISVIPASAPQFVDLALPSNVGWASGNIYKSGSSYYIANIIAESSSTYDLYFSWGNVVGYPGQSNEQINGYSFTEQAYASTPGASLTGDIPAGDTTYDAPAALLGSGARLPSSTDVQELLQYTTAEPYTVNGIQGALLTSTLNGNKIFIPLSGYAINNVINFKGETAWYHTSTYGTSNARMLFVDYYENTLTLNLSSSPKDHGTLIRPVKDITIFNFECTGTVQSRQFSAGSYKIECWGAQGGSINSTYVGGKGGYSYGTLTLTESTTLYIYVGGQGEGGTDTGAKAGGFNGGGRGYSTSSTYIEEAGGGASDVRIGTDSLYARVIIAGGGGGAGSYNSTTGKYNGGYGGGATGGTGGQYGNSYRGGTGGSLTARGTSYYGNTSNSDTYGDLADFGIGGGAKSGVTSYQITGGGGGWYGGGYSRRGGGGGGSGYVYTSGTASNYPSGCLLNSNYYLSSAARYAGNVSFTSPSGDSETGHTGNGYVRITKL